MGFCKYEPYEDGLHILVKRHVLSSKHPPLFLLSGEKRQKRPSENEMSGRTGLLITISLCMIIKNEEAILPRCLNTLKEAVGEIIIMDTGSTGETVKTAGKFTRRV